jgi:glycosyltransferase involved in cell wall biosynthesis
MEITVVIPTFRRGKSARPALDSALGQEGVDVQVILVDDASRDGTRDEIAAWAAPNVRILDQPQNAGAPAARQRGTEEATTRLVAYLDDDDRWTPTHLRGCLDALAASPEARWAYSGVLWVDPALEPLYEQPLVAPADALPRLLAGNGLVTPSAVVVERDLALEVGGWDPRLRSIGDWDFVLRLVSRAPAAASAQHSVLYIRHDDSMSRTALDNAATELALLVERHREMARGHGLRVRTGQFWRWLAFNARDGGERLPAARFFLRAAVADRSYADLGRAAQALGRR